MDFDIACNLFVTKNLKLLLDTNFTGEDCVVYFKAFCRTISDLPVVGIEHVSDDEILLRLCAIIQQRVGILPASGGPVRPFRDTLQVPPPGLYKTVKERFPIFYEDVGSRYGRDRRRIADEYARDF